MCKFYVKSVLWLTDTSNGCTASLLGTRHRIPVCSVFLLKYSCSVAQIPALRALPLQGICSLDKEALHQEVQLHHVPAQWALWVNNPCWIATNSVIKEAQCAEVKNLNIETAKINWGSWQRSLQSNLVSAKGNCFILNEKEKLRVLKAPFWVQSLLVHSLLL